MTDQATVDLDASDQGTDEPTSSTPDGQGDPADLGDPGRRAIQAERTARAEAERQLRDAQQQLTTAAARITELETGTGEIATERDTARSEALRYRVAYTRGVPADAFDLLQGSDEDTLAAGADRLLALMGARPGSAPRPDPSQGSRTPTPQTVEAQFKAALGPMLNT